MSTATQTPPSERTLQEKIEHLGDLVRDPKSDLGADELPHLPELIDDWYNTDVDVTKEEFHRRILGVFKDSKHEEVYNGVMAQLPDETRKVLEAFIDGDKTAEEAGEAIKEVAPLELGVSSASSNFQTFSMMAQQVTPPSRTKGKETKDLTFQNWGRTVKNTPTVTYYPETVAEIIDIVRDAVAKNKGIRVAGFRHSWAPVFGRSNKAGQSTNGDVLISTLTEINASRLPNLTSVPTNLFQPKDTELNAINVITDPKFVGAPALKNGRKYVQVGTATTNEKFRRWCINTGNVTLPMNIIEVEITFGGSNATICHGAGINNPTLSDLVRRIDYIDVNGKEQFVNMSDPTLLKAASGCFGLLGVVTYITFECDAMCTAVMRPVKLDVIDAIPPPPEMKDSDIPAPLRQKRTQAEKDANVREFERRANEDFYAEWFWFPYSQQVWVNTWKTDTDTKNVVNYPSNAKTLYQVASTAIMNMAQEIGKHIHALQVAPQTQTSLLSWLAVKNFDDVKGTNKSIRTLLPNALHFQRGVQNIRVRNLEVEMALDSKKGKPNERDYTNVRRAWWDVIKTCYANAKTSPMRMPMEMRIMGSSEVTLAPQRGNKLGTCAIGILTLEAVSDIWVPYAQQVLDKWTSYKTNEGKPVVVKPHWAKEWYMYKVGGKPWVEKLVKEDYKEEIAEFQALMAAIGGGLGPTQIRLLHLLPAKDNDNPIECLLEVVAFEENPVYEALSYCWGDSTQLQEIKCNGEAFKVTESLFCALQHLRDESMERTLWIDAICINQNDLEERQSQVKLMTDIYTKSDRVVIWLGPDPASDGVNHLFEMVPTIPNLPGPQLSKRERTFFEMNVFDADRWRQDEDRNSSKVPGHIKKDFVIPQEVAKGAIAVLTRAWWSRIWTVQEMVLAPSAIIMCGHLAAPSSHVRRACADVLMHAVSDAFDTGDDDDLLNFGDLFEDPNGTIYMATMRLHSSLSAKMELGKLLRFLRWLKAKDPRDKVYGSLGIAASTYGIEPDYTISTVECYTRATFSIISGSRSLDIFSALRRPSCIKTTLAGLPSWVPDWSYDFSSVPEKEKGPSAINNPIMRENVRTPMMLEMADSFPEWKASRSNIPFTARLSSDSKTLILRGMILDELSCVGDKLEYPWPGPELQSENVVKEAIHDFKRNWRIYGSIGAAMDTIKGWQDLTFKNNNVQTISGETRMDAFLTTLLSNRIRLSADRRKALDYLEESIGTSFKMSSSRTVMNQLHLPNVAPKIYHKLLGFGKICSIDDSEILSFGKSFTDVQLAFDQRMAATGSGYLCMLPWPARVGDRIALLRGGRTPYVLRKAGEKWKIIGDCYVHGIMSGEAWSDDNSVIPSAIALSLFPPFFQPLTSRVTSIFNHIYMNRALKILGSHIEKRIIVAENGLFEDLPPDNVLTWHIHEALHQNEPRFEMADVIACRVFATVFAALESTTLTMTYALFNVCASNPSTQVWQALEEEALGVFTTYVDQASLNGLHIADSVIKETLRLNTAIKALSAEVMQEDGLTIDDRMIHLPQGARGWEFGVSEVFPQAMFIHASGVGDVKMHHVQGQSNVILVDSVVNSGQIVIEFIKRVVRLEPNIHITVVAGVVQAEAIAEDHLFAKVMRRHGAELVALRVSENKFTGTETTDTGNRLFNTTHLD
ncbi:hypothetical protein FPRO06_05025 [Fusarium proliferatum]|nr:hypothetical protein FPRO06_05025 [Fusarium proliferatum]